MWVDIIIIAIDAIVCSLCFGFMYRTQKVAKLRREVINKIFSFYDIDWRIEKYHEVEFSQMVFSFKPIKAESFWKDTSFLEATKGPVKSPFQPVQ